MGGGLIGVGLASVAFAQRCCLAALLWWVVVKWMTK